MKILAHANGFELKSEQEVFRICYLADTFRTVYKIENYRRDEDFKAKVNAGRLRRAL